MSDDQLQHAILLLKSGQRTEARALLVQILERDPKHEMAWLALAACLEIPAQKRFCLEKVLALNPANPQARPALERLAQAQAPDVSGTITSRSLMDQAQAAEAEASEAQVAEAEASEAQAAAAQGRFPEAYVAYSEVLEADPACVSALLGKGLAAGMLSTPQSIRVNEAMQCFHIALQTNPAPGLTFQDSGLKDQVIHHELKIAAHLNRLSTGVEILPKDAARLAYAALFMLGQVYSSGRGEEKDGQLLEALRSQVQRILDHEKRTWESRNIDLLERQDLISHIHHSILSSLPAELAAHSSFQSVLDSFFKTKSLKEVQPAAVEALPGSKAPGFFSRVSRYVFVRFLVVAATLCVSVYIAVLVANLGGYVDDITRANIDGALQGMAMGGYFRDFPPEEAAQALVDMRHEMEVSAGLYQPFLIRNARWTIEALAFRWSGEELWHTLPYTLLLFGVAAVLIFFISLPVSLALSLRYGSWLDRLMVALSPLSSAPSWVHGILLIVVFAIGLHWLPVSGIYDAEIPETRLGYALMVARHMVLPVAAIFMSVFFQLVYTWRTFFLIHSGEDYVEVAVAKGLPSRLIERRYILRPTLPFIITNYSLMVLGFWQSAIALEMFFDWPGIGRLYMSSIRVFSYSSNMVISLVTIFAYLLAVSFFLLEVMYVLVDPRVSLAKSSQSAEIGRNVQSPWITWSPGRLVVNWPRLEIPPLPRFKLDLKLTFAGWKDSFKRAAEGISHAWRELLRYPSAIVGLAVILVMLSVSLVALVALPYDEVVSYWNRIDVVDQPKFAMPAWVNLFRKDKLPETIIIDSKAGAADKQVKDLGQGTREITLTYRVDYPYDGFPQDLLLYLNASYQEKRPYLTLIWIPPDGEEFRVATFSTTPVSTYYFSQDQKLQRRLKSDFPQQKLFAGPDFTAEKAQSGQYILVVNALVFEEDADLDARLVLLGQVHGLAGTDHRRRDLFPALIWGAPAGLGVGLVGALLTSLAAMLLAAIGSWFGGPVDGLVQRLSEINLTLPMLPIGIMVYYVYSKNIWVIVLAIVIFTMLGSPIKNYRAAFLQVKQALYIEAALAYGTGNWRIIKNYLIPRIIPILVPQLVATIPGFIFLEATLAILGVYDLYLPTWGKIIYDALTKGAFQGYYYWILEPLVLLLITGMAFALVGFALDRIFNPRLRTL